MSQVSVMQAISVLFRVYSKSVQLAHPLAFYNIIQGLGEFELSYSSFLFRVSVSFPGTILGGKIVLMEFPKVRDCEILSFFFYFTFGALSSPSLADGC